MDERTHQILLALAWLGEATKAHLRDLCLTGMSDKTVQRALAPLLNGPEPLVAARSRHRYDGTTPRREAFVYALTNAGHARIRSDPAYPLKTNRTQYPAKLTDPVTVQRLEHQLLTTEAIVRLIALARLRSLSGVFVAHEVRLNRQRPEPVLDAVVMLHVGGEGASDRGVPWTKDMPLDDERTWRFAIESDRATEAVAVLGAKARAYCAALRDPRTIGDWYERYRSDLPVVLWVAPTQARLERIHTCWWKEWSYGSWMLATPFQLTHGEVTYYYNCERIELNLFAGKQLELIGTRLASTEAPAVTVSPAPTASTVITTGATTTPTITAVASRAPLAQAAVPPAAAVSQSQMFKAPPAPIVLAQAPPQPLTHRVVDGRKRSKVRPPTAADAATPAATATALLPTAPPTPTPAPLTDCGQVHVLADNVRLRPAPGLDNTPITKLHKGMLVTHRCTWQAAADGSGWVLIQTQKGQEGWVRSDLVEGMSLP